MIQPEKQYGINPVPAKIEKNKHYCGYFPQSHAIVIATYKERANCSSLFEIKSRLGNKEVMPMIESSIRMGHQVVAYRLCAGAVL